AATPFLWWQACRLPLQECSALASSLGRRHPLGERKAWRGTSFTIKHVGCESEILAAPRGGIFRRTSCGRDGERAGWQDRRTRVFWCASAALLVARNG